MVSRLKTLCRILVRHRFLLSAGLSAAGGIILKSVVLIPVADPLFRYVALQRPGIYAAFVWSFAIFLFTTPFLMLFMCFSLLYIHFYEEETAVTLGTLPDYPQPQYRQDLFLILGELHHQIEATPATHPQWLSIPEKGLYTEIAALGAIGSGKTRRQNMSRVAGSHCIRNSSIRIVCSNDARGSTEYAMPMHRFGAPAP